jgi:hypothetical protein
VVKYIKEQTRVRVPVSVCSCVGMRAA